MSEEAAEEVGGEGGGGEGAAAAAAAAAATTATAGRQDADSTPRSEVPAAVVNVFSPWTVSKSSQRPAAAANDYFTLRPFANEQAALPALSRSPSITPAPSVSTSSSDVTATGQLQVPDASVSLFRASEQLQHQRPAPQTQMSTQSIESTSSAVTVTANNAATSAPPVPPASQHLPGRSTPSDGQSMPPFPDQTFAALQSVQYPVRQHPRPVQLWRQKKLASSGQAARLPTSTSQIHTFSSALAASLPPSGSASQAHTPVSTPGPGLFTPTTATPPEDYDNPETPGTYASPFLHFTHRQAPKETHVADVDVDPISGRKLINHYEIIDELGRGTHGKVKLGRDLQLENTHVAIKIVERYSKRRKLGKLVSAAEDKVKKEVAILKKARHPNIVALLEVIDDPTRKKVYIVLEWVERGEIKWRVKAPKEIAVVEARRYSSEKLGHVDSQRAAEDEAVLIEAQRRLAREKRRRIRLDRNSLRRKLGEHEDNPATWSHELGGDDISEESEDDRLSHISTATSAARSFDDLRRPSRATSPLPPPPEDGPLHVEAQTPNPRLTDQLETSSPMTARDDAMYQFAALEGTMYGSYVGSLSTSSRGNSMSNSVHEADKSPANFAQWACEQLDDAGALDPELQYVPILTVQQARVAFRDTLLGLQYLHYQGIVHRDIKPPNLLQTVDYRVKISDFGVSYLGRPIHEGENGEDISEQEAQDFDEAKELAKTVGTPAFYAPELCITDPGEDPLPVTKAIDVWALGITLFCMLFARTPFVDTEWVMMRAIAEEEVYIPRRRLVPVNEEPDSRPSSHSRAFPSQPSGRRDVLDLVYEDVDDDLYDLLRRLLTKDPRKRITLEEVRHHPWLLSDLPNKAKWLEETDPARQSQGKKIEISTEDVKTAVVPLQFLDRVRSGIKKVTERLGFGSSTGDKSKQATRARAPSSAAHNTSAQASPNASPSSSSHSLNQEHRRQSLRGDDEILNALKQSRLVDRFGEHPLAKSVASSPEHERSEPLFSDPQPTLSTVNESVELALHPTPLRPTLSERSKTVMSTTGSVRTVKQADIGRGRASPPPSPGLPSTPVALASPGGSALQSIFGPGARLNLKARRDRSLPGSSEVRGRSLDRESIHSYDAHGEPSLALSQTSVEGQVQLPPVLQDLASKNSQLGSVQNSPAGSRAGSVVSSPHDKLPLYPPALSRNSSGRSLQSTSKLSEAQLSLLGSTPPRKQAPPSSIGLGDEHTRQAEVENIRRQVREAQEESEPTPPTLPALGDRTCPASPDDQLKRTMSQQPPPLELPTSASALETSPTIGTSHQPPATVSSTSDFGSAVSMSVSNPSIPSVISGASSIDPLDTMSFEDFDKKPNDSSGDTLHRRPLTIEEAVDEGYTPDQEQCFDAEEDEDEEDFESSSDSDGGLVMRRRSKTSQGVGNGDALFATAKRRRGTGLSARSRKSGRSDSNNTMKKVPTTEEVGPVADGTREKEE